MTGRFGAVIMWNLFNQRRELEREVYATLRPGDLYGGEHRTGRQPEDLVRYLLLANVPGLTFFAIVMSRVARQDAAYQEFYSAVWLMGMGTAIAVGAWVLFRLSRMGEGQAISMHQGYVEDGPSHQVRAVMKRAAVMKLLAYRVMIVSAIAFCIGVYLGLKGFIIL